VSPRLARNRWHTRSTPLLGGTGIFAGLLAAVVWHSRSTSSRRHANSAEYSEARDPLLAGLLDDVFGLSPLPKLAAQGALPRSCHCRRAC